MEKEKEKECCDIKIKMTEIENGYRLEVTGEGIKDKCRPFVENCCTDEKSWQEFMKSCCSPQTDKT